MSTTSTAAVAFRFFPNDKGNPPGKLADVEMLFVTGELAGMKLCGFAVWERKAGGRNVTFPARQYSVNGERRSFALMRPTEDATAQDRTRDLILAAYADHEAELAAPPAMTPAAAEAWARAEAGTLITAKEEQPRLPGEAGAVRDVEIAQPQFECPRADPNNFSLRADDAAHAQTTMRALFS